MTRALWSLCFIATVGLIGLCSADKHAIERSREVVLQSLNIDTTTAVEFHEDYDHLQRVRLFPSTVEHQYLVHVARAITEDEKTSIEQHIGSKFGAYIPHNTFLLVADQQSANRAVGHPLVQWVGDFAPQYKISAAVNSRPSQTIVVTLAPKQRDLASTQRIASTWEASINGKTEAVSADKIQVTISEASDISETVRWISVQPESHFIEPAVNYVPLNYFVSQEIQTHANSTALTAAGLDGTGVLVGLADTGIRTTSCYFSNGGAAPTNTLNLGAYKIVRYISSTGDSTDANGHGTSVAGTIAGQSSSTGSTYNGIAAGAKIHFTDLQSGSGSLNVPADIKSIFTTPAADGVNIFVTPFGSANAADWYGTDAASIDSYMFANPNFLVVASAGNNQSLSSLALSKNALIVGSSMSSVAGIINQQSVSVQNTVLNNAALYGPHVLSSFSARGPTPDGRMKPDIVAPGQNIYSASNAGDCNLASVQGTSYAAGVAGAAAALAQQYFTDSWYPSGFPDPVNGLYKTPTASLVKAMIIHSGQQLTLTDLNGNGLYSSLSEYPSSLQGFGRIQLDQSLIANAYSPANKDLFVYPDPSIGATQTLTTGQSLRYCVQAITSNANLKATLVWTDKESSPAAGHILVNDLDLAVVAQDGTTYRTNTAGGEFDSFNNVEQVNINGLVSGTSYAIHVYGRNVPVGPQGFSLVISGDIGYADCVGDFDQPDSLNRTCPNLCSGYGTCNPAGFCTGCTGRTGMDCSLVACPTTSGVVCSGNGYCDYTSSTCVCALNFDPSNNCLTALPPPVSTNSSSGTITPVSNKGAISTGLLVGTVIAAFIVGAVCSVFLGGFIAVKYLEYRRDKIQKNRETEEAEMH